MTLQTPPPPSISPRQMNLLRIVASMAWSDGTLEEEEVAVMLDRFSGIFAADAPQQRQIREELQDYLMQNIPLEELTPKLQTQEEKELVLRLGYEVIQASARTPEEERVNPEEAVAYERLVELLGLPIDAIQRIESESAAATSSGSLVDRLTQGLESFVQP